MAIDTLVTGGTVVTPERTLDASVAIDDGEIVGLGDASRFSSARQTIDATGKLVMPGVVDPHVHIDEVPENRAGTYRAETAAAALGGVTTVIDFAFQGGDRSLADPDAGLLDGIDHKRSKEAESHVDFSLHGVLHRDDPKTVDAVGAAVDCGVTSFKMFRSTYDVGVDTGFLVDAFTAIAEQDAVALCHTENPEVCDRLEARFRAEGRGEPGEYPRARPASAEAMAIDDALHLARAADVKYYGVHTTARASADVLARFREDGSRVRGETCTHYTALDHAVYEDHGNLAKIAPPIRSSADREAMFERLRDGTLSVVSTDHAVYTQATKAAEDWWDAPFGCNSLQRSLPVFHEVAVNQRGLSSPFLVRKMCSNPATTFGLPRKGTVEPGTDADLVVFDPDQSVDITADTNASNADYTIYEGHQVTGAVETTLLRGERIVENGTLVGQPGDGRFVERQVPDWAP